MTSYAFDPDGPVSSVVDHGETRDGIPLLRRQWRAEQPKAAVLLVHGLGEHSGRYEHVGRQLAAAGLHTVGYDQRGWGASGGSRAYVDRFDQYHDDLEDLLDEIETLGLPTVLLGHSMGGLVCASYVLRGRPRPELMVLSAPALGADAPKWMRLATGPMSRLAPKLRLKAPFETDVLSRDPRVGAAYESDPHVERTTSARLGAELLSTIDWCRDNITGLDVPTLLVHGAEDLLVPTDSSEIVEGLPGVERHVVAGARHEVFNEPEGPATVSMIIDWIDARLP